jgi:two-component system, chemotaxis family, protein-glutamate methylesterase/glutaminase
MMPIDRFRSLWNRGLMKRPSIYADAGAPLKPALSGPMETVEACARAAMKKIRVLIVDDSAVIRRMVTDLFAKEPGIEVAGTASNGRAALEKIENGNPDVVMLDVEMPELDGLETVRMIRERWQHLPVIMFSSLTEHGASTTLEALRLGASDYVTKPVRAAGVEGIFEQLRVDLIPKIKALCPMVDSEAATSLTPLPARLRPSPRSATRARIVAIGISTGGPNALHTLIPNLPGNLPVPVVIVQHMPAVFTRLLAEQLAKRSPLQVREGAAGIVINPGQVWIAPGGRHMALQRNSNAVQLVTNDGPPENSCRPAVDVLFRSVAECFGRDALAVVMTGMGKDGAAGCDRIRRAGGQVIVQDQSSAVVWGMPGSVVQAGLADQIVALDQLPEEICRRVGMTNRVRPLAPAPTA